MVAYFHLYQWYFLHDKKKTAHSYGARSGSGIIFKKEGTLLFLSLVFHWQLNSRLLTSRILQPLFIDTGIVEIFL